MFQFRRVVPSPDTEDISMEYLTQWLKLIIALVSVVIRTSGQRNCHAKSINHYALIGYQYKTIHRPNYPGCVRECLEDKLCKSINYLMTDGICGLNNQTKESSQANLVPRSNSIYFSNVIYSTVEQIPQITPVTTKQQTSQTKPGASFTSCLHVLLSGNSTGTGAYWLDPGNTGTPLQAWCDMSTDSGGWTVAVNVTFQSTTFPPVISEGKWRSLISKYNIMGTFFRPSTNTFINGKETMNFDQFHFYCYKKTVGRVVSIMTKNNTAGHQVLEYFLNDTYASSGNFPDACGSFEKLPDDTSILAQNCNLWGKPLGKWGHRSKVGGLRLTGRPFGYDKDHVVGLYKGTDTFACDDQYQTGIFSVGDKFIISVR